MKKVSKFIALSLVFSLVLTAFNLSIGSNKSSAEKATNQNYTKEDVEELADVLEVLFEESMIYDYKGTPIGFDKKVLDEKVADTEYSYLIDNIEQQGLAIDEGSSLNTVQGINSQGGISTFGIFNSAKRDAFIDKCINGKLKDAYGAGAVTGIVTAIRNSQYTKAAKKLLKLGVKGTLPGIIANLSWILGSCVYAADKKGL